jgi:polyisoprenoid-binding protein YceI
MKFHTLLATALALCGVAQAQTWTLDPSHTGISFSLKHLAVSTVRGELDKFEGTLTGDPKRPATLRADMNIQAASVNTKSDKRDEHIRGADFFDVAKFPSISFKGEKTEIRGKKLVMVGILTLHGVSKRVAIPFGANGPVVDPWKNNRLGLEGEFTIKRSDYGIVAYSGAVGEDVKIEISAEFTEAK